MAQGRLTPVGTLIALLATLALAPVADAGPRAVTWTATALDRNRDARVDGVALAGVPRALAGCPRWRISGATVRAVHHLGRGRVTVDVTEKLLRASWSPSIPCAPARRGVSRAGIRSPAALRRRRLAAASASASASVQPARTAAAPDAVSAPAPAVADAPA